MTHTFQIDEGQRQMILLAIAKLSLERPGWHWTLGETAERLGGRDMFEQFRGIHGATLADRASVAGSQTSLPPSDHSG